MKKKKKTSLDNNDVENKKRVEKNCATEMCDKIYCFTMLFQTQAIHTQVKFHLRRSTKCEEVHSKLFIFFSWTKFVLRRVVNYQQFELKFCDMYPVDWFFNSSKEHAKFLGADKRLLGKTVNEQSLSIFCHFKNAAFRAAEIDNQHITCFESIS